jgi:hypothetical protein
MNQKVTQHLINSRTAINLGRYHDAQDSLIKAVDALASERCQCQQSSTEDNPLTLDDLKCQVFKEWCYRYESDTFKIPIDFSNPDKPVIIGDFEIRRRK